MLSIRIVLSVNAINDILCVTKINVVSVKYAFRLEITFLSVMGSKAEVASSSINTLGFLKIALAIQILCLSPPDIFSDCSPTNV